jgi:hypothetical protein
VRFYGVTQSGFYFFDTGMYLNYGRILFDPYLMGATGDNHGLWQTLGKWLTIASQTDRPLWQLLVDARIFWGGREEWWYIRLISAVMGTATLAMLYGFAKKFSTSRIVPVLSVLFLAVLPSHVFYSRVGLPEATTTFLFLAGLYFYLFTRPLGLKTIYSGALFLAAFLTNYRLIILPLLVACVELFLSFAEQRKPDFIKFLSATGIFLIGIVVLSLSSGPYLTITSHWIFHQVDLAQEHFAWSNLATYPYIIFRLDGWPLGLLFFGNIYFILKKQWLLLLPFFLVCLQMAIFTFSSDKAARYLCMVTPFIALSAALLAAAWMENVHKPVGRAIAVGLCFLLISISGLKIGPFLTIHSAYNDAMTYLENIDPRAGVVTTQPLLLNLYVENRDRVRECPGIRDASFLELPASGYSYMILGPQAYVSWTSDGVSFSKDLGGIPGFFKNRITPMKTFPHLNSGMLERFVFEHNQNLMNSISFLSKDDDHTGDLYLYNIPEGLKVMNRLLQR